MRGEREFDCRVTQRVGSVKSSFGIRAEMADLVDGLITASTGAAEPVQTVLDRVRVLAPVRHTTPPSMFGNSGRGS